ncbi:MAG: hypothetical protein H7A30_00020 [Thermotogae bacterium]|nr:hypothetical protein [Thermotogota bacterium]
MIENGFYKLKNDYINLIHSVGSVYDDSKSRPIYCCIEDKNIKELFWCIPTSNIIHRSNDQIKKIKKYCSLDKRNIKWAYYYIGHTDRPAIYKISNCLPIIDKYIDNIYLSKGNHLFLKNKNDISIIRQKLSRILFTEKLYPDKFEQKITTIKNIMLRELGKNI